MKRTILIATLALLTGFSQSSFRSTPPSQLEALLEQYSKEYYALNPLEGTQAGINDYNNQIEITISKDYIKKAKALNHKYLNQLGVINKQA